MKKSLIALSLFLITSSAFAEDVTIVFCGFPGKMGGQVYSVRASLQGQKKKMSLISHVAGTAPKYSKEYDISDATLKYFKNGFELSVDRGRSGTLLISKAGRQSIVDINLVGVTDLNSRKRGTLSTGGKRTDYTCSLIK